MAETGGYTLTVLLLPKCSGHWEAAAQPGTTAPQQTGTEMMCVTSGPAFLRAGMPSLFSFSVWSQRTQGPRGWQ